MICPNCHVETDESSGFCQNCGNPLQRKEKFCSECGAKLQENAKFCPNCGKPLQEAPFFAAPEVKKAKGENWCAILGFVIALIPVYLGITGLIVNYIALRKQDQYEKYNGFAKAGAIISGIKIGFLALVSILMIIGISCM